MIDKCKWKRFLLLRKQLIHTGTMPKRKGNGGNGETSAKQPKLESFLKPSSSTGDSTAVEKKSSPGPTSTDDCLKDLLSESSWKDQLAGEFKKAYWSSLESSLAAEYKKGREIFPPRDLIFNAFHLTPFDKVKVVLLGQDPYHDDRQAHGLCFSVNKGIAPPPSLKNIFKELSSDINDDFIMPNHGDLTKWAQQGVLLLNATLTVQAHQANSHAKFGWQTFTDAVIQTISVKGDGIVFILWGGFAQKKAKLINSKKHTIIQTAHPSPLSVTKFLGCKCFSKTNAALSGYGKTPIDWRLD